MENTAAYQDYLAPMEGITGWIYRGAYHQCFSPMDKYFTPFLSGKKNKRLSRKEEEEVSPAYNPGMRLVPQILCNQAEDFIELARILMEYGHREINLNLGCPSGTVAAKKKGAGFLGEPRLLDQFLDQIFSALDLKISIKTRIGVEDPEEWETLLGIFAKYPLEELIVHPRLLTDQYRNTPDLEAFQKAQEVIHAPLCYNGDLFTPEDYSRVSGQFPENRRFMYGRGIIRYPGLKSLIRNGVPMTAGQLRKFHDLLYTAYQERLSGDRNVLFRMKEIWAHMLFSFAEAEPYGKKIRKSQSCREYEIIVDRLFRECPLRGFQDASSA